MWPIFLYMNKDECLRNLRQLELDAYSMLVSALRAQGPLTQEKRKALKDTCKLLNISSERHKCEVRRAINDEKLNTIAYHMNVPGTPLEDWCQEGRRMWPMLQRISPQTLHPIISENLGHAAQAIPQNYQELSHSNKRPRATIPSEMLREQSYEINNLENVIDENESDQELEKPAVLTKIPRLYRHQTNHRQDSSMELDKVDTKTYSIRKLVDKNQKPMTVSNTETTPPTSSILHRTLSVPISKVTKLNLEKYKIVPSSTSTIPVSSSSSINTQNFLSNKTARKVIPLSQLQMLNHKLSSKGGIKVLPISSKLFGKNITMTHIINQHGLKTTVLQPLNSGNNPDISKIKVESIELLPDLVNDEAAEDGVESKQIQNCEDNITKETCEEITIDTTTLTIIPKNKDKSDVTEYRLRSDETNEIKVEYKEDIEEKGAFRNDGLASLMEVDSREFIDSGLKDTFTIKKES